MEIEHFWMVWLITTAFTLGLIIYPHKPSIAIPMLLLMVIILGEITMEILEKNYETK